MALITDRMTVLRDGEVVSVPVAAGVKCFAGGMAVLDGGYAKPGGTATGLVYFGSFNEFMDNTGGAAGDKEVLVRRHLAHRWENSPTDPVTQADVGSDCYIVDDETVARTNGTNTRSKAGLIIGVDADGVWVE